MPAAHPTLLFRAIRLGFALVLLLPIGARAQTPRSDPAPGYGAILIGVPQHDDGGLTLPFPNRDVELLRSTLIQARGSDPGNMI